jgi:hypothetical protein
MEAKLKYRGRQITDQDVAFVRDLIAQNPTLSRKGLSRELCKAWNWRQANGVLRDMVARGLMLLMHRSGWIELPAVRRVMPNPFLARKKPALIEVDRMPLEAKLAAIQPLEFRQVRRTPQEKLVQSLIEAHHYLGYKQPVGEHLKYLVLTQGRPIACLLWCSAPFQLGPRDRFIGWTREAREKNLHLVAYNTRFLILPWVKVPHLASHILGRMAKLLPVDWEKLYGHSVCFLETFTDASRYRGTCYLAANWIRLGQTTGRGGKSSPRGEQRVALKEILCYPLTKRFREILGDSGGDNERWNESI